MGFHHNLKNNLVKTKITKRNLRTRISMLGTAVIVTVAAFVGSVNIQNRAYAADPAQLQQKINALQNQINDYQNRSGELSKQADTLSGKIDELKNQQSEIQAQIDLSSAKKEQLESQIADKEKQIKEQATALSKNLENMYYSSQTSSLDVLMNSDNVSDYVDKQVRQQTANDQISKGVDQVKSLKKELEKQKADVEALITKQNAQKRALADNQAEQQKLLDDTQGQEEKFKQLTADTQKQMDSVKKELEEVNRILRENAAKASQSGHSVGKPVPGAQGSNGAVCGGGYPTYLCSRAQDSMIDPWGMYNRECVSYAAFRVANDNGYMPRWGGHGMAYQWKGNAQAAGYKVTKTPAPGTVAWRGKSGTTPVGHVGFVESVSGNTYVVSEYNATGNGTYRKYQYTVGDGTFTDFLWISK